MLDIEDIFFNRQVNFERLLDYGFEKVDEKYVYHLLLMDGQFEAIIQIDLNGVISEQLIDVFTNEKYALIYSPQANGQFVGRVREIYERLLRNIADVCFDEIGFKSKYTKDIIDYVENKYGDLLEFPWGKDDGNAIIRHQKNRKWYVVILRVSKEKLGIDEKSLIDILNVKNTPDSIQTIVDKKHFFPSYHMNKKYWMSIPLDGTVPLEEIYHLIDISYELTQ